VPLGVEDEDAIVSELVKVGEPEGGRKEHEAPDGSPPTQERLTDIDGPPSKVTFIVLEPEPPWNMVIVPEFEMEKSKIWTETATEWDSEPLVPVIVTE
jgi:hypothetical protein